MKEARAGEAGGAGGVCHRDCSYGMMVVAGSGKSITIGRSASRHRVAYTTWLGEVATWLSIQIQLLFLS